MYVYHLHWWGCVMLITSVKPMSNGQRSLSNIYIWNYSVLLFWTFSSRLNPVKLKEDYYAAMKTVAKSLDILQWKKNTHMGWLLLTLYKVLSKLKKNKISVNLSFPVVTGLLSPIRHRFAGMLEDPELNAAAVILPKFKNVWANQSIIINKGISYDHIS